MYIRSELATGQSIFILTSAASNKISEKILFYMAVNKNAKGYWDKNVSPKLNGNVFKHEVSYFELRYG